MGFIKFDLTGTKSAWTEKKFNTECFFFLRAGRIQFLLAASSLIQST